MLDKIQDNVANLHEGEDSARDEERTLAFVTVISIAQLGESNVVSGQNWEEYGEADQQRIQEL